MLALWRCFSRTRPTCSCRCPPSLPPRKTLFLLNFTPSTYTFIALQARNGSTALDVARAHGRQHVEALLAGHMQWEVVACAVAAASLRCNLAFTCARGVRWRNDVLAIARTRAACGLMSLQRASLLRSGGCALLLTVRVTKHDALTIESPSRMLRQLLLRQCWGGALAHWLLRQHALKILGEAPWLHAHCDEGVGGTERCYGD